MTAAYDPDITSVSMAPLFDPVDIYCERVSSGMWMEPLNTVSNLAFFIAVYCLYRLYKAHGRRDGKSLILMTLVGVVGCGSALFHLFGNTLTLLADVIPITLFVYFYLWTGLRRLLTWSQGRSVLGLAAFFFAQIGLAKLPVPNLNGSIDYVPCLIAIALIGWGLKTRGDVASARTLFTAALIFLASLTCRTLDLPLCDAIPAGIHYFWHILNSVVLYLLVAAVIRKSAVTLH